MTRWNWGEHQNPILHGHVGRVPSFLGRDLRRKAKVSLFKQFMGTDEIALPVFVGAMFGFHWNDHAGQIAKIRKANGMPDA